MVMHSISDHADESYLQALENYVSSHLLNAAFKQKERTKQYVACTSGAVASPVIVTLHDDSIMFCDKVPIVPIHKFASFVEEFYGNLEKMDIIEKSS